MLHRLSTQLLKLVLGLAFVLSVSLSAAQAAAMAAQMATMPGMDMSGHQDCGGCADTTDKGSMKNAMCVQFCVPALAAILPTEPTLGTAATITKIAFGQPSELSWASAPNPSPPRF